MSVSFRNFENGIRLIPQNNAGEVPTRAGEFRYNSSTNKFEFFDTVLKTFVGLSSNTITGDTGSVLTVQSASGQDLDLNVQGTATLRLQSAGTDRLTIAATTGVVTVSSTTASTTKTTGSLVLGGGLGVAGQITANNLVLTSALPISSGGTGQSTASTAFDALSPLTTKGDLIAYSTTNARLAVGSNGQALVADSTQALGVKWGNVLTNPMTTLGDIIYEDATPTPVRLAGNTTTTKKFLTQTGNGTISAAPGWNTIVAGDLSTIASLDNTSGVTIHGTNTNNNAASGYIGEYIESVVSTGTNFTFTGGSTGQYVDATSISLTAGDWDITFIIGVTSQSAASVTNVISGISTTNGNSNTGLIFGSNRLDWDLTTGLSTGARLSAILPSYRQSISGTTTFYGKINIAYTGTSPTFQCRLSARRVR